MISSNDDLWNHPDEQIRLTNGESYLEVQSD